MLDAMKERLEFPALKKAALAQWTRWKPDAFIVERFAEEVVEEFASFPVGEHDDLVDSSTQALLRFRQGGFVPLESDEEEERFQPKKAEYY